MILRAKFVHPALPLNFPSRDEEELLSSCPLLLQNKSQEIGVQDIVNRNKKI